MESPIVPVWVALPYLPVHYIHCKPALFSIAAAIGTPLRVDHATASVNRLSVARVLVEYDVSKPLLPRIWIGEKDSGFWQDVVFERVPAYCSQLRHLLSRLGRIGLPNMLLLLIIGLQSPRYGPLWIRVRVLDLSWFLLFRRLLTQFGLLLS